MKDIFKTILEHPIATGIVVGTVAAGVAKIVKAANKSE
jgi:hypothetical protein